MQIEIQPMVSRTLVFAALLCGLTSPPGRGQSKPLSNEDVLQMAGYKFTDAEIIAAIERNSGNTNFTINAAETAALKTKGVTEPVIKAMALAAINASASSIPSTGNTPSVPGSCSAAAKAGATGMKVPSLDQGTVSDPSKLELKGKIGDPNSGAQQNSAATASSSVPNEVRFCVNDLPQAVTTDHPEGLSEGITNASSANPSFTFTQDTANRKGQKSPGAGNTTAQELKLQPGDLLTVQALQKTDGKNIVYGPVSKAIPVGKCSKSGTANAGSTITLNTLSNGNIITGKLDNGKAGTVRICIDDLEVKRVEASSDGTFSATLDTQVDQGQTLTAQQVTSPKDAGPEKYGIVSDPLHLTGSSVFDFGRVRITFSGGAILSQSQNQFSQASGYLNFNVENTWLMANPWITKKDRTNWRGEVKGGASKFVPKQLNTSFDARLTALPVTSCNSSTGASSTASMACSGLPSSDTFITTPKAALIAVHLYFPYYYKPMTWHRYEDDGFNHRYALFFAPLAVGGFQTLVQSAQNVSSGAGTTNPQSTVTVGGQTFFHFAAAGLRFGLYKFHDHEGTGNSVAPDNPLYFDITYGKYENFSVPSTTPGGAPDHPLRIGMEGRFTIPKIPIFLGFDSNTRVGNSPGDLRFLFGTSFDVGCLVQKLGVTNPGIASCDTKPSAGANAQQSGSSAPASTNSSAGGNKPQPKG